MNIMYNVFKTAKQVGETEERGGPYSSLVPWGGKTGDLIHSRPEPLLCLQTQARVPKFWALGTFCSFDLQGEPLGQQNQKLANIPTVVGPKRIFFLIKKNNIKSKACSAGSKLRFGGSLNTVPSDSAPLKSGEILAQINSPNGQSVNYGKR